MTSSSGRTGLSERLVVESRLSDLKHIPFLAIDLAVDVDHVEILVLRQGKAQVVSAASRKQPSYHPKLMRIFVNEDGPVLRWVRVLVDLLGNKLAKPGFLGEPLPCKSRNGMPADFYLSGLTGDLRLAGRDGIGLVAQSHRLFQLEFALEQFILPSRQAILASRRGAVSMRDERRSPYGGDGLLQE